VSRALDKPCVVGCDALDVRPAEGVFLIGGREHREGDEVSVDGATGELIAGIVPRSVPQRNLSSLSELLARADHRSGCQVWTRVSSAAGAEIPQRTGTAGVGIVSLTDLLVSSGGIDELIGAIGAYGDAADAPAAAVEDVVDRICYQALRPLLTACPDRPVHVRVPTMTSPRARSWIHEWTALAPHLLVPLGPRRLLTSYVRAISAAARDTGHAQTSLLIGGITDASELVAFAAMLGPEPAVGAGAVLQNPVVLHDPSRLTAQGHALWVDLADLVRTSCGRPDELLYLTGGLLGSVDGAWLPELVSDQLGRLVTAAAGQSALGVEVAGHANPDITRGLHSLGFRRFTSTAGQAEELRLALGQYADGED
jgi:pyruvate,orthophosphate dikinase